MLVDVALLWEWEYDHDFIQILDNQCVQFGLTCSHHSSLQS